MADRRFPPPWSVEDTGTGSAFVVKDGSGRTPETHVLSFFGRTGRPCEAATLQVRRKGEFLAAGSTASDDGRS
jgi:hypothetical protein